MDVRCAAQVTDRLQAGVHHVLCASGAGSSRARWAILSPAPIAAKQVMLAVPARLTYDFEDDELLGDGPQHTQVQVPLDSESQVGGRCPNLNLAIGLDF